MAQNRLPLSLAWLAADADADAKAVGWGLLALGLPASGDQFDTGRCLQHLEVQDAWPKRGLVDADHTRLLHSPLGPARPRELAMTWFAAGSAQAPA